MNNMGNNYMGNQGMMRPGNFPPNQQQANMFNSHSNMGNNVSNMSMNNAGPNNYSGNGMRPMVNMCQYNGQMGNSYMQGNGGQVRIEKP